MKKETRYKYEKRIKELESELCGLRIYRFICSEVYNTILANWYEGKSTSESWIIGKFERLWR